MQFHINIKCFKIFPTLCSWCIICRPNLCW